MSQAIMSIRQLKPDVRLAQSIQRFQSLLSNEQQAAFHATRDAALQSTPQPHDVMHITEEIERQARASTGGGWRCFAPRITKVLQSLQEFVSVGDILIGGSQNLIACGVWSVVRLSLLTAARVSSYLEKLSDLLMAMGQTAPRYQEMVALYPHSKSLQRLGIEYMIALVNLCCRVVTICKASPIGRLVTFFTDSNISSHQSELLRWADAIKDQLSLEEAKANSRARGILSTFTSENLHHKKLKSLAALLNACPAFDYQMAWDQARKCGNASWFLYEEIYQQPDHIESQKHQTVVGCLTRQVFQALRLEDTDEFDSELQRKLPKDINQLFALKIIRSKYIFVVLDGIDECNHEDRSYIIEFLARLKVCVSYRLTANTLVRDELEGLGSSAALQMPENNPDIAQFIQAKLESYLETKKLTVGDPLIILEILQTLEAALQIETICAQKTDNQIREALHNLPKDLPETFTRILASANKSAPEFQKRLLKLLLAALTVHFIHPSVNQFLLGDFGLGHSFYIEPSLADLEMAQIVVTYLSYNVFDRQVARVKETPNVSHRKLYETIVCSTIASPAAQSLALMLLRSQRKTDFDVGKALSNLKLTATKRHHVVSFYEYASTNWIAHTKAVRSDDVRLYSMIRKALDRSQKPMLVKFNTEETLAQAPGIETKILLRNFMPFRFQLKLGISESPILWSLQNSHLGILCAMIRRSIANVLYIIAYLKSMNCAHMEFTFSKPEPHIYLKLFSLAALFRKYSICYKILASKSPPIPLMDMADLIPPTPLNGLAVALILVHAQAYYGFTRPTFEINLVDHQHFYGQYWGTMRDFIIIKDCEVKDKDGKLIILHAGEEVVLFGDLDSDEVQVLPRNRNHLFFLSPYYLHPLFGVPRFRTCCDTHVGVLIDETRLCTCCVPQKYRQVVGQLGDLDLEESIPRVKIPKTYGASRVKKLRADETLAPFVEDCLG
ncbi:hypothetical protein GGS24DRAFT_504322 [Hypoxylon argillaceum]|nr:hypothetical protein GGS24DRAFT_504322 [Hypoxylon argillaceum]